MKRPAVLITAVTIMLLSLLAAPSPAAAATVRLVPDADVANAWQATPGGPAWSTLDENVTQPAPVDATDRIWAGAAGRVAHVALSTNPLGGDYARSGVVWFYANTGSGTQLQVEVITQSAVLSTVTVAAGSGFGWRQLSFPALRQGGLDDLQVRLTALGGGDTNVRALYASVETAAFRAVVDLETAANRQIVEIETPDWNRQVGPYAHGATTVTSTARTGAYAARFELRQGEAASPTLKSRSEITTAHPDAGVIERWYGFSIYLPSDTWASDSLAEILTQWHQTGGSGSPPLSIGARNGKWEVALFGTPLTSPTLNVAYGTNKWTDWVVHVRWAADSTGYFELWRDNEPVLLKATPSSPAVHRIDGATNYDNLGVHTKFGIYKWGWNGLPSVPANKRVIFYDDLRIADQTAGYAAVRP